MKLQIKTFSIFLLIFLLSGCSHFIKDGSDSPQLTYKQKPYVIGVSDQLRIDVWRNQELTRSVSVRPDGFVTIPLMGDVKAEGRTPESLAEVISDALKTVIKNPEVTVTVTAPVSVAYQFRVRVMGEVVQPASVAFVDGMTVMDLVLAAGGMTPYGAGNRATLNRLTEDGYKEYDVRINDILQKGDITTNHLLQPSDILTVPEKQFWRGEF